MKYIKEYEDKKIDRNGYNIMFKTYFEYENVYEDLYEHIDILDENNIDYDIFYHKSFIKIIAYAANVQEYNILMKIDFKIDRYIQPNILSSMTLDKIRNITTLNSKWKLTSKEALPYLKDTNKFNI